MLLINFQLNKKPDLLNIICTEKPDILAGTETWLSDLEVVKSFHLITHI